jgi:hypothetical protein
MQCKLQRVRAKLKSTWHGEVQQFHRSLRCGGREQGHANAAWERLESAARRAPRDSQSSGRKINKGPAVGDKRSAVGVVFGPPGLNDIVPDERPQPYHPFGWFTL